MYSYHIIMTEASLNGLKILVEDIQNEHTMDPNKDKVYLYVKTLGDAILDAPVYGVKAQW